MGTGLHVPFVEGGPWGVPPQRRLSCAGHTLRAACLFPSFSLRDNLRGGRRFGAAQLLGEDAPTSPSRRYRRVQRGPRLALMGRLKRPKIVQLDSEFNDLAKNA